MAVKIVMANQPDIPAFALGLNRFDLCWHQYPRLKWVTGRMAQRLRPYNVAGGRLSTVLVAQLVLWYEERHRLFRSLSSKRKVNHEKTF